MDLVWLSPPSNNWNNLRIGFEGIKSGTVLMIGTLSIRDIESPHTVTETQRTLHWNIMSWDTSDSCLHLPGWNSSCSCYRRTITGDNIGWCWCVLTVVTKTNSNTDAGSCDHWSLVHQCPVQSETTSVTTLISTSQGSIFCLHTEADHWLTVYIGWWHMWHSEVQCQ